MQVAETNAKRRKAGIVQPIMNDTAGAQAVFLGGPCGVATESLQWQAAELGFHP
jgi:hypothetical protein